MHCKPDEIAYTHSGTEANNLAITGLALAAKTRKKIVISAIEHLSVVFPAEQLAQAGFRVVKIPVDRDGFVNRTHLPASWTTRHCLSVSHLSTMRSGSSRTSGPSWISSRTMMRRYKVHLDACDAFTKIPLDLEATGADLVSFSSHKVYGPKGAGALYIREGIELKPIIHGQLSTQKLWAGIENIPAIAGFATAASTHAGAL